MVFNAFPVTYRLLRFRNTSSLQLTSVGVYNVEPAGPGNFTTSLILYIRFSPSVTFFLSSFQWPNGLKFYFLLYHDAILAKFWEKRWKDPHDPGNNLIKVYDVEFCSSRSVFVVAMEIFRVFVELHTTNGILYLLLSQFLSSSVMLALSVRYDKIFTYAIWASTVFSNVAMSSQYARVVFHFTADGISSIAHNNNSGALFNERVILRLW